MEAAKLERDGAARGALGAQLQKDLEGEIEGEGIRWRAFASCKRGEEPPSAKADGKETVRYRISAVSWQVQGEGSALPLKNDEETGKKCSRSTACYRYEKGRLVFEHWVR